MANVSGLLKMATGLLQTVKNMPTAQKVAMGAIFGGGLLVGNYIGDGFERQTPKEETTTPSDSLKQDTLAVAPKKEEVVSKPKFEYVPPKVGEKGVVKADTTYYVSTSRPASIRYSYKGGTLHITNFDEKGNFAGYTIATKGDNYYKEIEYNKNGDYVSSYRESTDEKWTETIEYSERIPGRDWYTGYSSHTTVKYKDGTCEEINNKTNEKEKYDKNDRLISKKKYDENDVLQYTVIPKYNKDGDLIKNDTIRNEHNKK